MFFPHELTKIIKLTVKKNRTECSFTLKFINYKSLYGVLKFSIKNFILSFRVIFFIDRLRTYLAVDGALSLAISAIPNKILDITPVPQHKAINADPIIAKGATSSEAPVTAAKHAVFKIIYCPKF